MKHALTIDVEDYYMSPPDIETKDWSRFPKRIDSSLPLLLDWMAERRQGGTFFVLGWIAERFPALIRRVAEAGHELGIHGWDHRHVRDLKPHDFASDLDRALNAVRSASGEKVLGYRAPAFSLDQHTPWAYDILLDRGFQYDASCAPYFGWLYGEPFAIDQAHHRRAQSGRLLLVIPLTTIGPRPFRLPVCGGFFLRIYPFFLTRYLLRRCAKRGRSAVAYLHPWEAEASHPALPLTRTQNWIHYLGLRGSPRKIRHLLREFQFTSIRDLLETNAISPPPVRNVTFQDVPS